MHEKSPTVTPLPKENLVLGMPGEHGFYVHADLRERIAAQHSINPGIPNRAPQEETHISADLTLPAENVDTARKAVANAFVDASAPIAQEQVNTTTQPEALSQHFSRSVEEIKVPYTERQPYSLEAADQEQPLTHYTKAGNIFQILRFGVQSNNFKNRVNALRASDPKLDAIAPTMSGLRIKQGGSYQGGDSISLDQYTARPHIPPGNVSVLINPNIKTYGAKPEERDATSGYGHGIVVKEMEGDFKVGNPTAYKTELLAANVVPSSDVRAILIPDSTSILRGMADVSRENAVLYSQAKLKDHAGAKEDLLASCRLLTGLTDSDDLQGEIDVLASQLDTMPTNDIAKSIIKLQARALQEFVGAGTELTEETLRAAIRERFNIEFLQPKQ